VWTDACIPRYLLVAIPAKLHTWLRLDGWRWFQEKSENQHNNTGENKDMGEGRPATIIKRPNTNTSPPEKSNGDLFTQQVVSQPYISLCRN
jgi:hypothetical protein